jgi:hypothetical protein
VVLITDSQYIGALRERWNPKDADDSEGDADASGDSAK